MAQNQESYIQPYSNEAESAVLGALILSSESFYEINQLLTGDMFYNEKNQKIYQTLFSMHKNNIPVDMVTLVRELQKNKQLDEYLSPLYIAQLTEMVGSSLHIKEHAMYIKQEYIKREVMKIAQQTLSSIVSGDDIADILNQLSNKVNKLEEGSTNTDTLKHISKFANSAIGEATNRVSNYRSGVNNGVTTGLSNLDKITGGWQKGEIIIIAARPAMGKTALAIKFLESAALSGSNVAMFALEMKGERLIDRIILEKTGIQDWKYKRGSLTNEELMLVEDTSNELFRLPVYIDDNSSQTISKIKSKCRLLKKKNKCDLVIIDYLQLTEGEGNSNNREQEVSKISREAKKLAKSLDVPVIMLSQLSRLVETRSDKRPQLSDLRESGAIEQDADMVCFIHRPDYYNQSLELNNQEIHNGIELIIAKYREGATGSVYLQHDGSIRNIKDYNTFQIHQFKK